MAEQIKETLTFGKDAWLELKGKRVVLTSPFKIGRTPNCNCQIDDTLASREHAMLQYDDSDDHWLLIDMESTNGTKHNGVGVTRRPVALEDGDRVTVGYHEFIFHQKNRLPPRPTRNEEPATMLQVFSADRWMLLADVNGSTRLSQELDQEVLSNKLRTWVKECEAIIHASGGVVNEYLGDGIIVFWQAESASEEELVRALRKFGALKSDSGLDFRVLLHFGTVQVGGGVSNAREKMAGKELNFLFKSDKLVRDFRRRVCLSQAAADRLGPRFPFEPLGAAKIAGFSDDAAFYGLKSEESTRDEKQDRSVCPFL